MKKLMIALLVTILFGTATASLYAANPEPSAQLSGQETEAGFQQIKMAQPEEPKLEDIPLCTPQDATEPKKYEGQTEDPPEDIQEEAIDQTQVETSEDLPSEDLPPEEDVPSAPTEPESLIPPDSEQGKKQYKMLKNTLFSDYENWGAKKIVTETLENGSFLAEDLGTWLKKQDFYQISVIEDDGVYKTLYYKCNLEAQEKEQQRLASAADEAILHFDWLVNEGDLITFTDSCLEAVTSVESNGSFYTTYSFCEIPAEYYNSDVPGEDIPEDESPVTEDAPNF